MPDKSRPPVGICLATRTIPARLVIRRSYPGKPACWPLLVAICPWAPPFKVPHTHLHTLCTPGPRQLKLAPCNRRPYILKVTG